MSVSGATLDSRTGSWRLWMVLVAGTLIALPFTLTLALCSSLSHDEHQHIAAGVLYAKEGLLPYRDFPYFHVPYLVYAYGFLFQITEHYLLASRLFSAACAALTGGVIFTVAWKLFSARTVMQRFMIGVGAVVLLITAPVFFDTAGHSWNQEPSVLLALLGFLFLYSGHRQSKSAGKLLLAGLLIGLAIGMRVTVAPLVLPFLIMLWLGGGTLKERLGKAAVFCAGIALALIPVVWTAASGPAGFIFGNIEFPKVNIDYRLATGEPRTMTLLKKLRFLFKEVMRPNAVLFYGFLAVWVLIAIRSRAQFRQWPRLFLFLLLSLPFLFMGALAPSPAYDQYFYPLAPFLLVGVMALIASIPSDSPVLRRVWGVAALLVITSAVLSGGKYEEMKKLFKHSQWIPTEMHAEATELRRLVPQGKVLTLTPTLPLEAGLDIYPEFATGPFAWRVADFVSPEKRVAARIIGPADLEARLASDPPAAILLGDEKRWEGPLESYARKHHYQRIPLQEKRQLWLPQ